MATETISDSDLEMLGAAMADAEAERSAHESTLPLMVRAAADVGSGAIGRQVSPAQVGQAFQTLKPTIAPTVGSLVGAATPIPGGSSIGSMAGEGFNQLTGITEPSLTQLAMAGAVPAGLSALPTAMKMGRQLLPSAGARMLNELAPGEAALRMAKYGSAQDLKVAASQGFRKASDLGVKIPMTKTVEAIDDTLASLRHGSEQVMKENGPVIRRLESTKQKILSSEGLSPADLQAELSGYGNFKSTVQKKGGAGLGAYKRVAGSMDDDLEAATTIPSNRLFSPSQAAQTLQQARQTYKRGQTLEEIQDAITKATKPKAGHGLESQFNGAEVIKELRTNKFYKSSFDAAERKDIESTFELLNRLPPMPPPKGAKFGSGPVWERMALAGTLGGAGAAAAYGASHRQDYAAGSFLAGVAIPSIADTAGTIATTMQFQTGRALLRSMLKDSGGAVTPKVLAVLGAFLTAQQAQPKLEQAMTQPTP